jgi:hypothetical protein
MSVQVKTGKAQCEHMLCALPLRADIAQCNRHVRFVPKSGPCDREQSDLGMRSLSDKRTNSLPVKLPAIDIASSSDTPLKIRLNVRRFIDVVPGDLDNSNRASEAQVTTFHIGITDCSN